MPKYYLIHVFKIILQILFFSSTAAVYGNPLDTDPIKETTMLKPLNPYGKSKMQTERILAKQQNT